MPRDDGGRPGINVGALFASLVFGAIAAVGFTGSFSWIFADATKWTAAGLVALIGLVLLLTAFPGRSSD